MSSDSERDMRHPWRTYGVLDDAMLAARPPHPAKWEADLTDAAFVAGFLLAERIAHEAAGGTQP